MPRETTYMQALASLASVCREVIDNRDFVLINRRGNEQVALIAASELESLMEMAHLLRSPKNAERLMAALNRARAKTETPQSLVELRWEVGLESEDM